MFVPRTISLIFLVLSTLVASEQPGSELIVLIKANINSVNISYFKNDVIPFIKNISTVLTFPEEVSNQNENFARISINIGGTKKWPRVSLYSQSRTFFENELDVLSMPTDVYDAGSGSIAALESALKTTYASSVTNNRILLLLTDHVLPSDAESDIVKKLHCICSMMIVVGIPSFQHLSFNDSLHAARSLVGSNVGAQNVFASIDDALNRAIPVKELIRFDITFAGPVITCKRVVFLYENSEYVSLEAQSDFAYAINRTRTYMFVDEVAALSSYEDFLNDGLVFLDPNRLAKWDVEFSSSYDPMGHHTIDVFEKLAKMSQTPGFQHFDIVLLTQSDVYAPNITEPASDLANQATVNVFILDTSQNQTDSNLFDILTKNQSDYYFDVADANATVMTEILADNVTVMTFFQSCQDFVPETSSTLPTVLTTQTTQTTPLTVKTTPSSTNSMRLSIMVLLIVVWFA